MSSNTIKKTISGALAVSAEKSKAAASASLQLATKGSRKTTEWATANPRMALTVGAGAALVVAPMAIAAPVLGAVGFGAQGVVAGSTAAGIQSGLGSVVAPSLFATLQSAAAGGYGVAVIVPIVQGVGGALASVAGAATFLKRSEK
ncbi:hypothetical protein F5Y19DRAFT_475178 [Xylariaceae sp. FL1651]|nr:hypothetical protein F5Y19DRAFT_475178 [Xylariaceae sp. FL1651]